jgi:TolB-like protein
MKRCPQCNRVETDGTLGFCRADGTALVGDSGRVSTEDGTVKFTSAPVSTSVLPHRSTPPEIDRLTAPTTVLPAQQPQGATKERGKPKRRKALVAIASLIAVALIAGVYLYWPRGKNAAAPIESIAVMPFVNESGNADLDYLSDGMTETLISSLSQLQNLNVRPRSSVFHYKGKETNPHTIGNELNVQAILNGRVTQRGQDLSLFVELIEVALDRVVWSQQYNRKQNDLVTLQTDIARDVSSRLMSKLSGADEAKVTKTYTTNADAYQLYLKGKYYQSKYNEDSYRRAIDHYQQAINIDPNYALAYLGIAEV